MILRNQKSVLVAILVLLVITLALIVGGNYYKANYKEEKKESEVPAKEVVTLTFEVDDEEYTYECKSDKCKMALETVDDSLYEINHYNSEVEDGLTIINDKFVFIDDSNGKEVKLYNFVNGTTLASYKAFKSYNVGIEENVYIVQNRDEKWGVIQILDDTIKQIIPFEYAFVGIPYGMFDGNSLSSELYLVYDEERWTVINKENLELYSSIEPVVDFNDKYVVTAGDHFSLKDYADRRVLNGNYKYLALIGNYVGIYEDSFYIYDLATSSTKSRYYYIDSIDEISYSIEKDGSIFFSRDNESEVID